MKTDYMKRKHTDRHFFMIMTAVITFAIAVIMYLFYSSYKETGPDLTERQISENEAEAVMQHLNYDGRKLDTAVVLNKYDGKGRLLQKDVRLKDLVCGRKCIAIFSINNCSECAGHEMALLNNLNLSQDIVAVYNEPVHEHAALKKIPLKCYYEISKGRIFETSEMKSEFPVLLYTENGRVITSCVVNGTAGPFVRHFHEFIIKKINHKE